MKRWIPLIAAIILISATTACNNTRTGTVDKSTSSEQMDSMVEQVQSSFDSTTTTVGDSIDSKTDRAGDKIDSTFQQH